MVSLGEGVLRDIAQYLPSYWLVQASHVSLGGAAWPATGWLVVVAWGPRSPSSLGSPSAATPGASERLGAA